MGMHAGIDDRIDDQGGYGDVHASSNDQVLRIQKFGMGVEGISVLPNRLRFAYPAELDLMARLAGFVPEIRWRDWERREFTAHSDDLIAVYRKAGDGPIADPGTAS